MQVKNYEPSILVLLAAYNCTVTLKDNDGHITNVHASEVVFNPEAGFLVKSGTVINFSTNARYVTIRDGLLQVKGWTLHVEDSPFIRKRLLAYLEGVVVNSALEAFSGSKVVGGKVVNSDGSDIEEDSMGDISSHSVRLTAIESVSKAVAYMMSHYFC